MNNFARTYFTRTFVNIYIMHACLRQEIQSSLHTDYWFVMLVVVQKVQRTLVALRLLARFDFVEESSPPRRRTVLVNQENVHVALQHVRHHLQLNVRPVSAVSGHLRVAHVT